MSTPHGRDWNGRHGPPRRRPFCFSLNMQRCSPINEQLYWPAERDFEKLLNNALVEYFPARSRARVAARFQYSSPRVGEIVITFAVQRNKRDIFNMNG